MSRQASTHPDRVLKTCTLDGVEVTYTSEIDELIREWNRNGQFLGSYVMMLKGGQAAKAKRMAKLGLCVVKTFDNGNVGFGPKRVTRVRFTEPGAALVRRITRRNIKVHDHFLGIEKG